MNEFITKDLYLASYLSSLNCERKGHERVNGVTTFVFIRTPELDEFVGKYFSSSASVNPLKYDEAMKTLRTIAMGPKHNNERTLSGRVTV
jgi:hypothetical protein